VKSILGNETFREAINEVSEAYRQLGHQFGWVFLHTPADTLSSSTRLFLIALNPASKSKAKPEESDEKGNAYRVRDWHGNRKSVLQKQVCAFYEMLATKLRRNWKSLMDSSLAANFCPFGSPSWAALPKKQKSREFSIDLWARIVGFCAPSAIVCLSKICFDCMAEVTTKCGYYCVGGFQQHPTDWGKITYTVAEMSGPSKLVLVGLPHLSRYQIFHRKNADDAFQPLMEKLTEYLTTAKIDSEQNEASVKPETNLKF